MVKDSGNIYTTKIKRKQEKSEWRMPWLREAKKDVISCEKPRVDANNL